MLWSVLSYLLLAKKPTGCKGAKDEFSQVAAGVTMVALYPVWLIGTLCYFFIKRKGLRWLKKYWICFALHRAYCIANDPTAKLRLIKQYK